MDGQLVFIVDDRNTNLRILEKLASSLGEGTLACTFTDPLAALAAAAKESPDLVITDLKMPSLDGVAFIRRLKAEPKCADVPVIVVTAYEDGDLRYQALDAGATDFLLSPVDHREFRARSRNLLHLRRRQKLVERKARSLEEQIAREEHHHRNALEDSHRRLLQVIDAVPAMISARDAEGRYVFVNREFASAIGVPAERLIGKTPVELGDDPLSCRATEFEARLALAETLPASCEAELTDAEGRQRFLLITQSALREGGAEARMVTVAVDISARKRAELDLVAAKEQAELANRSKTEFLANMSHELRTPLNAIIGFSQVIAGEMLGPIATRKYVDYSHDIAESAEHLLGIINDILDVSKIEAGKLELSEGPVELAKLLRDLLRIVEAKARAGGVRIEPSLAKGIPAIRGDPRKIKQILLNLLSNAIKFSHRGGVVEVTLKSESDAVVLAVADHGIGMDSAEQQLAVSRFGQVASPWSRRHPGTGLGLPLAIALAELHGGRVEIESSKGVGTTATVRFPRDRSLLPAPIGANARPATQGA